MSAITIAGESGADGAAELAWVAASLPAVLRRVEQAPDVVAVNGTAGWTARAGRALRDGAVGVLVVAPDVEDTDDLHRIAEERGVFVILDRRWHSNPAVREAMEALRRLQAALCTVSVDVNVPETADIASAVHEALHVARSVVGTLTDVRVLHRGSRNALVSGTAADGAVLTITAAVSRTVVHPLELHVVTRTGGLHLSVPDPATARPGLVSVVHADGITTSPTRWESAHRASWRRVIDAVEQGTRPSELQEFAAVSRLLTGDPSTSS